MYLLVSTGLVTAQNEKVYTILITNSNLHLIICTCIVTQVDGIK